MKRLRSFKFLIVLSMLFVMTISPVSATEHVVTSLDGGTEVPGSLRNIFLSVGPGDVITFQDGLIGTINLTGSISPSWDFTIQGPGADLITISGASLTEDASLIMINVGVNADISGLSFVGADVGIQYGAAVWNAGNLRLSECSFVGNMASCGGAICNETLNLSSVASMDIVNCEFLLNQADDLGGAIYNAGNLRLSDCSFSNNHADFGGAISNATGLIDPVASMDLFDCQFLSNLGDDCGGAIYNDGNLKIVSCDLSDNIADSNGGGAIYNYQDLTIERSELSNNQANFSGGGAILTNGGKLTVNDCKLNNNEALNNRDGGAIYSRNAEGGTFLTGCTFESNKARYGGAIRNYDQVNSHSGGVSLSLTNCILKNNEAQYGGGIYSNPRYNKTILTNCFIADNIATESAGGINSGNNNLKMRKCTVSGNIAGVSGGGIYTSNIESYVTRLWNCTISGNVVSSDPGEGGGGVLVQDGTFQTSNCTITDNSAPKGGGLSVLNGNIGMKNTIIAFNEAETSGDIFIAPTGSVNYSATGTGYNMAGEDPENWFVYFGDMVLSDDITSADVFAGVEEGLEVGAPGSAEKMQVLALAAGSIAIDAAHWFDLFEKPVSEDQRGVFRPQGDYNDIGAYEFVPEPVYYSITTISSAGGTIEPVSADVLEGTDKTFTVTVYDGYILSDLLDGDESVSAYMVGNDYTFTNVEQDHTLSATFIIDPAMKEEAGVGDFQVEDEGIGSLSQGDLVPEEDITSLGIGELTSEDVNGFLEDEGIETDNFISGVSFDVTYSSDEGNDIFALDLTLDISREDLGQDACDVIDSGEDLTEAFFENISIYKIVSPDVYDLFNVASEDQDLAEPVDFFGVTGDEESYHVSMSIVIEDNTVAEGERAVEAVVSGLDNYFYVYDGVTDGKFTDPLVAVRKSALQEPPAEYDDDVDDSDTPVTSGGGNCNVGAFPAVFGLLMVPLMFLLRR